MDSCGVKRFTKSNNYCSVPQCSQFYDGNVSFHTHPSYNKKLAEEWARVLKIGKPVTRTMRVCSKHFQNEDFFFKDHVIKKHRIKKNVVPSLNLPVGTHDRKQNIELIQKRQNRAEKRASLQDCKAAEVLRHPAVTEIVDTITTQETAIAPLNVRDSETLEAANLLLELSTPNIQEKYFEDKAVQVNTYEEFRTYDLADVINNDQKLKILTGVESITLLNTLTLLIARLNTSKSHFSNKKRILLTMMKVKLDLTFRSLSVLFQISSQSCQTYFHETIDQLSTILKPVIRFPSKAEILSNIPICFFKFRQTRIVLDCTEIEIQKSRCLECRIKTYSHYKCHHTVKFLFGVAPSGLITFVSRPYGGQMSDKAILNNEQLISKLNPADAIMVDKGFLIDKECAEHQITLIRPPFLKGSLQLTKSDAVRTAEIARARVHVERAIQRVKNFHTFKNTVPWSLLPQLENVMCVVLGLVNLSSPLLAPDKY